MMMENVGSPQNLFPWHIPSKVNRTIVCTYNRYPNAVNAFASSLASIFPDRSTSNLERKYFFIKYLFCSRKIILQQNCRLCLQMWLNWFLTSNSTPFWVITQHFLLPQNDTRSLGKTSPTVKDHWYCTAKFNLTLT